MAADAHAHPRDLLALFPGAEEERRRLAVPCAASAWTEEEFTLHRELAAAAERDAAAPYRLCFAVHPQAPGRAVETGFPGAGEAGFHRSLELLAQFAAAGSLAGVGETGFDLYDDAFRETEKIQEKLFAAHLEIARTYKLPVVLHVRRAMHKIFLYAGALKQLPAVVFHSWPGSPGEGFSLLRRGIPAFFSFGAALMLNHKRAIRSCAAFPLERILLETDAPWQPLRGRAFSSWADLSAILRAAAAIRKEAGVPGGGEAELEKGTDKNFFSVFGAP
ncbi:MAG: TatD family hydrolase [Spirochaetaceae bacterium]|jgi:TatD DNase family protein|nr:TatD family hydrolase [Spirochaetaceae bacterium]